MISTAKARLAWGLSLATLAVTACTSSMGSGMTPLTPPAPQGSPYGVVPNNAPQSRQQIAEAVDPIQKDESHVALASLGGFTFAIDMTKPSAAPSTQPSPASSAGARAAAKPTPKPTPTPTPSPSPTATASPAASKSSPAATPTGPHVDAKITIYPDGTQKPPGDSESEQSHRVPVVKVVVQPSIDVSLYSLGALVFTVPKVEQEEDRGFTVALYETRKNHKDSLIDSASDASDDDGTIRAANAKDHHTLSSGHTYTVILFGDPLPATPSPYSPPQYPGAPMQYQQQQPQYGQPGQPPMGQPGYATPAPFQTPLPFQTPQPFPTPHF